MDSHSASIHFDVTERTVRNWWSLSCPSWVDKYVDLYQRSIPKTKEWDGFKFVNGRLFTPYDKLTFAPSELMKIFYDRQFNRLDRVERQKLRVQVAELRSDDEAKAIREEIDEMIKTLQKVKLSPIVAPELVYAEKVRNKRK
ncbi:DUF3653 domain-containing protein [Shewanella sp. VB17]|uniref:DUF3653 domain-containing protein n=1 Tax=Shewanella sp. VB17 TaxID=2739432 RepID=UPI0020B90266|nr:DUF3653 domain-containing protein [Shewanella sp. VB17]